MTTDQVIQLVFHLLLMLVTMTVVALTIRMLRTFAWERPQMRRDLEREDALWHEIIRDRAVRNAGLAACEEYLRQTLTALESEPGVFPSEAKVVDAWNEESER